MTREEKRYACPTGHSFDRAAAGYVHLLPANKMHSKDPGDDKGMATARNRFLSGDYYAPLRDTLAELACAYAPEHVRILDAGCVIRILKGTFLVEGIGAVLFSLRFIPEFGFIKGVGYAIFSHFFVCLTAQPERLLHL